MEYIIYPIIGWVCGMFTALFLYAWLDERDDRYAGIEVSTALGLATNYRERAEAVREVIVTTCAYCRHRTQSRYCRPCQVYYCLEHNAKAHAGCEDA